MFLNKFQTTSLCMNNFNMREPLYLIHSYLNILLMYNYFLKLTLKTYGQDNFSSALAALQFMSSNKFLRIKLW